MFSSIKTSQANKTVVKELTNRLGLGPENVIARLAFAYSISLGRKLDNTTISDSKGKEYSSKVLFGEYFPIYIAIICQHYNINKNDENIPRYIKMHIDDGLNLLSAILKTNPNLPLFDFFWGQIEQGLSII